MSRIILAGTLVISFFCCSSLRSQTALLKEQIKRDSTFHIELKMQLNGKLRFQVKDKISSLPITASADHQLVERTLNVDKDGLMTRVVREYLKAHSAFHVSSHRSSHSLRKECKVFVVQRPDGETLTWCITEPLYRSELDLTQHLDTLALPGLLPGKETKVGEPWNLSKSVVQYLGHFNGLIEHSLEGKLESIKDNQAHFSIKGKAKGIEQGALVRLEINAKGCFDLSKKCIIWLQWTQKDERDQGPASPALSAELTTTLNRTPTSKLPSLQDGKLKEVTDDFKVAPLYAQLEYLDPKGRYSFLHDRDWHISASSGNQLVMRLLDRGDFIAQVSITDWPTAEKGKHTSAEDFVKAMNSLKDWKPSQQLQSKEIPSREGLWMYRHSAIGELEGVEVLQNFYLLASDSGRQLRVTFTLTPKQAQRFGNRGLTLVNGIVLK